jgi:hypothetical protein
MNLLLAAAAAGVARSAHYIVPTGGTQPIQTLLLEPARTNLCIRSEEFNTWTQTNATVTADAIAAPDGTMTADLLTASSNTAGRVRRDVTLAASEACASVYLKQGTSLNTRVAIRDNGAGVDRHSVNVIWSAGVPTLSTQTGSGTLYPVESLRDGWYRILFSATGIVAGTNEVRINPDYNLGTGTVYAWGAQVENAVVPSSYIPTAANTVQRNADNLYFPFTAPPQALTVYVRGVAREFPPANARPLIAVGTSVGIGSGTNNQLHLTGRTDGRFRAVYNVGGTEVLAQPAANTAPALGDLAEFRVGITSDGRAMIGQSVNNGAELTAMSATALGFPTDWNQPRIALATSSATATMFAFTHVLVAAGEQSLSTMRQLAGVI